MNARDHAIFEQFNIARPLSRFGNFTSSRDTCLQGKYLKKLHGSTPTLTTGMALDHHTRGSHNHHLGSPCSKARNRSLQIVLRSDSLWCARIGLAARAYPSKSFQARRLSTGLFQLGRCAKETPDRRHRYWALCCVSDSDSPRGLSILFLPRPEIKAIPISRSPSRALRLNGSHLA